MNGSINVFLTMELHASNSIVSAYREEKLLVPAFIPDAIQRPQLNTEDVTEWNL